MAVTSNKLCAASASSGVTPAAGSGHNPEPHTSQLSSASGAPLPRTSPGKSCGQYAVLGSTNPWCFRAYGRQYEHTLLPTTFPL